MTENTGLIDEKPSTKGVLCVRVYANEQLIGETCDERVACAVLNTVHLGMGLELQVEGKKV